MIAIENHSHQIMKTPTQPEEWEAHLQGIDSDFAEAKKLLEQPENRFLLPLVKPGKEILEAGSGFGRYVFAFAIAGANSVGVDFAQKLTEKVQNQAKQMNLDNASAVTGDIMDLPFEDNRFDLYSSFGVYEHFTREQHKILFAEAFRVLKPNGLIYLDVPQFWSLWTVRRELRYWFRKWFPPSIVWQRNMRRNYVIRHAEEAGFETVESHVFDAGFGFQKTFSLDRRRLKGVPNLFHRLGPLFERAANFCDEREWLGHTLVYIGRKPDGRRH